MATFKLKKEKALVEDIDFGTGTSSGTRVGIQVNASNIPYDSVKSIKDELDSKESSLGGDIRYAFKGGTVGQVFKLGTAIDDNDGVNVNYLNSELNSYPTTVQVTAALTTRAYINGSGAETFNVDSPIFPNVPNPTETVNFTYLLAWFNGTIQPAIDDKADKVTTLDTITEHAPYVPSLPYHPSTKDYVDQKVLDIGAGDMTVAEYVDPLTPDVSGAVYTTKGVGAFGSVNGIADADKGTMKLSENTITDCNTISAFGIGIFIGVDVANSPPASAGIPIAIEQMDMNGQGIMLGQRATTDIGTYVRFGIDVGGGVVFTLWSKAVTEVEMIEYFQSAYATDTVAGTIKRRVSGTDLYFSTTSSPA